MSVGGNLAEARRQSGLTVTDVSQRTCIRETIIRAIEQDDYAGCGGDFYARGDIRAIARAVGADPVPLIRDYDAAHPSSQQVTAAELFRPVTPVGLAGRRRVNWTVVLALALAIVLGLAAYLALSGAGRAHSRAAAGPQRAARHHQRRAAAPPVTPARQPGRVVVQVTAVADCWVEFTTPAGAYLSQSYLVAGTSKRWTFARAVDMRLGNPGGVRLLVNGQNPLPPGTTHPVTLSLRPHRTPG